VTGADGNAYALAANFGAERALVSVNFSLAITAAENLVTGETPDLTDGVLEVDLDPGAAIRLLIS